MNVTAMKKSIMGRCPVLVCLVLAAACGGGGSAGPDAGEAIPDAAAADAPGAVDADSCVDGTLGCPCDQGTCSGDLVCGQEDVCRPAVTCQDLRDAGECVPHQTCEESPGQDARCIPESCEEAYYWDAAGAGCVPYATCTLGVPGSIGAACAAEHRECMVQDGDDVCGGCVSGTVPENGQCVSELFCGEVTCGTGEYCDRLDAQGPTCKPWPCPDVNQAQTGDGTCQVCTRSCDVEGSTGRTWPVRDQQGRCVCETRPGYFFVAGATNAPMICDGDADGWVVDTVREPLYDEDSPQADPALVQNMRCDVRTIDRVVLQDEYGERVEVRSCAGGLEMNPDPAACKPVLPLHLVESERNDQPGTLHNDATGHAPSYGDRGLRGNEVNALSKACVDSQADFNDNGVEDFKEVQGMGGAALSEEEERLLSFSYFVELNTIAYEHDTGAPHGRLVIAERPRCDSDGFPLRYDDRGSYDPADGATYWRSCYRNRDPGYDASESRAGFDFAQWSCDATTGSCPAAPPAHATLDLGGVVDPDAQALVRDHGRCELSGAPADGIWRGMNHHSQFKCVEVSNDPPADSRDRVRPDGFGPSGALVMNDCRARRCDPGDLDCIESRQVALNDNSDPVVECTARPDAPVPVLGEVGWVAERYQPYGDIDGDGVDNGADYAGSCVNENEEWPYLCPFPEFPASEVSGETFGRYRCYGWDSSFLWAAPDETGTDYNRASLLWAGSAGVPADNQSVWACHRSSSGECL